MGPWLTKEICLWRFGLESVSGAAKWLGKATIGYPGTQYRGFAVSSWDVKCWGPTWRKPPWFCGIGAWKHSVVLEGSHEQNWCLVGGLEMFVYIYVYNNYRTNWNMTLFVPYIRNVIIPTDEVIFFRGVLSTTNQVLSIGNWRIAVVLHSRMTYFKTPIAWWEWHEIDIGILGTDIEKYESQWSYFFLDPILG